MGAERPSRKGIKYQRAVCDFCHGEIPLRKDGRLWIHSDRANPFYGTGSKVKICVGSRSRNHSAIRHDQ